MFVDETIEGDIESLAFGGQGVMRVDGRVVFIPYTAPRDKIRCRIVQIKKNYAEAKLLEVLKEGPDRISPRCPYYGTCGGCQLQHLDYPAQISYKQQAVADILKRIGGITFDVPPSITASTLIWEYRRHITLSLLPLAGRYRAGYTAIDNTSLLPVTQCPIFTHTGSSVFEELDYILQELTIETEDEGRATLLKTGNDSFLVTFRFKRLPANCGDVLAKAKRRWSGWSGLTAVSPKSTITEGVMTTEVNIDTLTFTLSSDAFIQNHPEQSLNIYRDIATGTRDSGSRKVLDLYCGIGISTLLAAETADQVIGIELNPKAVAMAVDNAKSNRILNVKFYAADVKAKIKGILKKDRPDLVIINPPRGGLDKEVIEALEEVPPERIFYISCMPSTLARDAKLLCQRSFKVEKCKIYDMFPQTSHVETLLELVRATESCT